MLHQVMYGWISIIFFKWANVLVDNNHYMGYVWHELFIHTFPFYILIILSYWQPGLSFYINASQTACNAFPFSSLGQGTQLHGAWMVKVTFRLDYWTDSFVWRIIHRYILILTQTIKKQICCQMFTNTAHLGYLRI